MSQLTEYGIMQEDSDTRAHVCAKVRRVYVFDTEEARKVIRQHDYPIRPASQSEVDGETAKGWLVPVADISGIVGIRLRDCTWQELDFSSSRSTSELGQEAVRLVTAMIKNGRFPFPAHAKADVDLDVEIDGTDIIASIPSQSRRIQVKCDRPGGHEQFGGTGNLFLQKSERNPRGLHDGENKVQYSDLFGEPALSK